MMNNKNFDLNEPIIVGLSGKAGSGKTSVAENIVPKGAIDTTRNGAKWDHIFYALPLYELASIKRTIKGTNERSRQLYAIHDVLYDIYGRNPLGKIPDYEDLVSRSMKIKDLSVEPEGVKPRSFLQTSGDICKDGFNNCFADWAIYKIKSMHRNYLRSIGEEDPLPYVVIVSDVRFEAEASSILSQRNGMVICFDASPNVLEERLIKRDGKVMDLNHSLHRSELEIDTIKNTCEIIINTDNMSVEQQTHATMSAIGFLETKENAIYA